MMKHFEYLSQFQELSVSFDPSKEDHLILLSQLLINCGNIGNTTRPFDVAVIMARRLQNEYEKQAEQEDKLKVEISGMGDTASNNIADIELNFYTAIAKPLLEILGKLDSNLTDFAIQMEDNKRQWEEYKMKSI